MRKKISTLALAAAAAAAAPAYASCGGGFCQVNTNWDTQGAWQQPGMRLDLRYEYIDQDQLRRGTDKVSPEGVPDTHDEVRTLNRNWVLNADYSFNPEWGVSLQLPFVNRNHTHIHNDPLLGPMTETWDISAVGDARVLGRYRFARGGDAAASAGVLFGAKLASGAIDKTNADGEKAERSLQPGTGSTDALVGVYVGGNAAPDWGWFAQALWQHAVSSKDDYTPGNRASLDLGTSYRLSPALAFMLQLNLQSKARDEGANAEPSDSGGRYAFLTPGLSYAVTENTQVYGFTQRPLYQYVNGTQLTADWSAVIGVSHRL